MMAPYASEVEYFKVGRAIGNVKNNSADLLKPLHPSAPAQASLL